MGLKPLATYELTLKDCRVGADARLGGDKGIDFSRLMSESRVAFAAMGVGVMNAAFEYARDYAKERKAFGVPIATKQAIAFILADMAIEIDAARLLVWEAAYATRQGPRRAEGKLPREAITSRSSALKVTDNARAGARRPRLYPRASGRDVAAQRAWFFRDRRNRNGLRSRP